MKRKLKNLMNKKEIYTLSAVAILVIAGAYLYFYNRTPSTTPINLTPWENEEDPENEEPQGDVEYDGWEITTVAQNLQVPWDMAFFEDELIFVTERPGNVAVFDGGWNFMHSIPVNGVTEIGEGGLLGVELHPDFETNNYIYLYYTYREDNTTLNRVSRFEYSNGSLNNETHILTGFPGASNHNAGGLAFGPTQRYLYILSGDASQASLAQDEHSLAGKILRLQDDGSLIPSQNFFSNSAVYSMGHRNPQGLDWHPLTGELLATEHGNQAHDEVNIIQGGQNYGWPNEMRCFANNPAFRDPIICSGTTTWAPSGGAFIGLEHEGFENAFFFAGLRGQILQKADIVDGQAQNLETIISGNYGRLRSVVADGRGNIYVGTSNRDGRGNPRANDDVILKISPRVIEQ